MKIEYFPQTVCFAFYSNLIKSQREMVIKFPAMVLRFSFVVLPTNEIDMEKLRAN